MPTPGTSHDPPRAAGKASPPRRGFHVPARVFVRVGLYLVACWSTLGVLAHDAVPAGAWIVTALATYTTIPLVVFLRFGGWPFYPGRWFRLLVLRPFWYVELLLPLITLSGAIGIVAGALVREPLLWGRVAAGAVLAVMVVILLGGYFGSRRLVVRRFSVGIPALPREFNGTHIAQISDLHIGPHIPRRTTLRIARTIQALEPDLIAVTGDLVDDRPEDVAIVADRLSALRAPLGVFVIAGNHDVYAGWSDVERELDRLGVGTLLVNESHVLSRGSAHVAIVGTGDPAGAQFPGGKIHAAPDVTAALDGVTGMPVIALAHNPALWPSLAQRGVALTLSGHTHWGQFAIPWLNWSLASPFLEHSMGAYQDGDALLYISPGTGYWGIPFRLGAPAEVTLFTLRRGPSAIRSEGE